MIAALVCSSSFMFASIAGLSTRIPQSKSYDELLHELTEAEINRRAVIVKVADEAASEKSSVLNKFMQTAAEADEALVNIRLYFDAGKNMFDINKGNSSIQKADVAAKTYLLKVENYLPDQMLRLSASLKTLEALMNDLSVDECSIPRQLINAIFGRVKMYWFKLQDSLELMWLKLRENLKKEKRADGRNR